MNGNNGNGSQTLYPATTQMLRAVEERLQQKDTALDTKVDEVNSNIVKTVKEIFRVVAYPQQAGTPEPKDIWGGIWVENEDLKGRTIVGSGTVDDKTFTLGETGGEVNHTLTEAEMPSHAHPPIYFERIAHEEYKGYSWSYGTMDGDVDGPSGSRGAEWSGMRRVGGSQSHNNLQPYYVVTYWNYVGEELTEDIKNESI